MNPERIRAAVDEGERQFWRVIAEGFPEVKTGDFDPFHANLLRSTMEWAVTLWLKKNGGF